VFYPVLNDLPEYRWRPIAELGILKSIYFLRRFIKYEYWDESELTSEKLGVSGDTLVPIRPSTL